MTLDEFLNKTIKEEACKIITFGRYEEKLTEKELENYFMKTQIDLEQSFYPNFYLNKFNF